MVITSFYAISFSKETFFGNFVIFSFLRETFYGIWAVKHAILSSFTLMMIYYNTQLMHIIIIISGENWQVKWGKNHEKVEIRHDILGLKFMKTLHHDRVQCHLVVFEIKM